MAINLQKQVNTVEQKVENIASLLDKHKRIEKTDFIQEKLSPALPSPTSSNQVLVEKGKKFVSDLKKSGYILIYLAVVLVSQYWENPDQWPIALGVLAGMGGLLLKGQTETQLKSELEKQIDLFTEKINKLNDKISELTDMNLQLQKEKFKMESELALLKKGP